MANYIKRLAGIKQDWTTTQQGSKVRKGYLDCGLTVYSSEKTEERTGYKPMPGDMVEIATTPGGWAYIVDKF